MPLVVRPAHSCERLPRRFCTRNASGLRHADARRPCSAIMHRSVLRLIFTSNNESANHCFSSKVLKHVAFQNNKQASGFIGNDICNAHQQLEWLDLSGSTFVSGLPPCFDKMTNLKYLDLSSTSTLPDTWLKGLVSIERIEWGNNVHHVTNKGSSKTTHPRQCGVNPKRLKLSVTQCLVPGCVH